MTIVCFVIFYQEKFLHWWPLGSHSPTNFVQFQSYHVVKSAMHTIFIYSKIFVIS